MTSVVPNLATGPPVERPVQKVVEAVRVPHITLHAFCDTAEMSGIIENALADRRMSRAHATVHSGGMAAALTLYRQTASPNLVIIECKEATALHSQLEELASICQPSTKVVVIGYVNDVSLYRELIIQGISEYIVAPVSSVSIVVAICRLYEDAAATKLGRTFAFVGAKGGAGSSTVANNVASTVGRFTGRDVVLAELDLPFGSASLDFNLDPLQGIVQAIEDPERLDDVLLERLLTKCDEHLSILTAPATLAQCYDLSEDAIVRVIELAQANVPFVAIDVPHIWTSWAKKTLLMADEVVITAVPDLANLRNARHLVDLLKQARPNDAPPKVVLNQVGMPKRSEIELSKFADALGLPMSACIPFEPATFSSAANKGKMIADISPHSAICASFVKVAQALTGSTPLKADWRSKFNFASLWRA